MKFILGVIFLLSLGLLLSSSVRLTAQQKPESTKNKDSSKSSPEQQETEALRKAFRSSESNPLALIRNLEDFLARFPKSPLREQVMGTIYEESLKANAPDTAIVYGEKLLEIHPTDATVLTTIVDLLDRKTDPGSRAQAVEWATRLLDVMKKQSQAPAPPQVSKQDWTQRWAQRLAAVYARRGELLEKSGKPDKALADFQNSYAAYPNSLAAEHLGDLAAARGDVDSAIRHYATSFAFPDPETSQVSREKVRRKLGKAYVQRHGSEQGLGDLILARYDQLMQQLASRFEEEKAENADSRNPYDYVLERPDGSSLKMQDYRGKVLVLDFWATWCPPCRVEGKLLARVMETFRNEPRAAFLAVNMDDDTGVVPQFLKEENWTVPVVYGKSLGRLMRVRSLPTLVIFDPQGRVIFREEGLDFGSFVSTLEKKVHEALGQGTVTAASARSAH